MKKAYNVYSIFEKLNLTTGIKAFIVLLMFSICFLGSSSEASAQSLSLSAPQVDQTFLKDYDLKEDKDSARQVIRGQQAILSSFEPANGLDEAIYASKYHFLSDMGSILGDQGNSSVMIAVTIAHTNLVAYVGNLDPSVNVLIDVERIVTDYISLLQ